MIYLFFHLQLLLHASCYLRAWLLLQEGGCRSGLQVHSFSAFHSLSPRPLQKVQLPHPCLAPSPWQKLAFWHITPAAQLDTHLLHFSGYNPWVGKLGLFSAAHLLGRGKSISGG